MVTSFGPLCKVTIVEVCKDWRQRRCSQVCDKVGSYGGDRERELGQALWCKTDACAGNSEYEGEEDVLYAYVVRRAGVVGFAGTDFGACSSVIRSPIRHEDPSLTLEGRVHIAQNGLNPKIISVSHSHSNWTLLHPYPAISSNPPYIHLSPINSNSQLNNNHNQPNYDINPDQVGTGTTSW